MNDNLLPSKDGTSCLKVLLSAYACRPGEGSEPGVSWNIARELAKYHKVWVLTRANNRPGIEAELERQPIPGLQFLYCDVPVVQQLNRGQKLVQLHYYLWQIVAYGVARKLQQQVEFDIIHHVTYVRYWGPSFLSLLPVPFVWGPVGGGESAPPEFDRDFGTRGRFYELSRNLARGLGELDPFVRITARRSCLARATTEETAAKLRQLGAPQVEVLSQLGLSEEELDFLAQYAQPTGERVCFVSAGRLLHWKGFHLGLRAFARAKLPEGSEYWVIGDGSERSRLQALVNELGIGDRVTFWNKLSREETLKRLGECTALVHPSLHESGGLVCLEAMAAGLPVLCLNLGGPAIQVTENTGIRVTAYTPEQTVRDLATAMTKLAEQPELRSQFGKAAQKRAREVFSWEVKGRALAQRYETILLQQARFS